MVIPRDTFYGNITLSSETDVRNLGNAGYKIITGNLSVTGSSIVSLNLLDNKIVEIQGSLSINASRLSSCDGLYGLKRIGGSLTYNTPNSEGLNNIEYIGGDLYGSGNNNPYSVLGNLNYVGGVLKVSHNTLGLSNLEVVGGLEIMWSPSFEGLEKLRYINGDFLLKEVGSTPELQSFNGLSNLESIKGSFIIEGSSGASNGFNGLTSFVGLEKLKTIGGSFAMTSYGPGFNSLKSFEGLDNLEIIAGSFLISFRKYNNNPYVYGLGSLSSFSGFKNLKLIGGNFIIESNLTSELTTGPFLRNCVSFGFPKLETISGDLIITVTFGLDNLTSFGLSSLTSIGGNFTINCDLRSLSSFAGLEKLKTIGGSFGITHPAYGLYSHSALSSFDGLEQLIALQNLTIKSSHRLRNVNALSGITSVNNISSTDCGISNYCPLKPVVEKMTGTWYLLGNSYNPTKTQMLNANAALLENNNQKL